MASSDFDAQKMLAMMRHRALHEPAKARALGEVLTNAGNDTTEETPKAAKPPSATPSTTAPTPELARTGPDVPDLIARRKPLATHALSSMEYDPWQEWAASPCKRPAPPPSATLPGSDWLKLPADAASYRPPPLQQPPCGSSEGGVRKQLPDAPPFGCAGAPPPSGASEGSAAGAPKLRGDPISAVTLDSSQYDQAAGKYSCNTCYTWRPKSDIYITAEEKHSTWQGHLEMECFDCYSEHNAPVDSKQWRRMCKKAWVARSVAIRGLVPTLRKTTYEKAKQAIVARYQGESLAAWRSRLFDQCREVAEHIRDCSMKLMAVQQANVMSALSKWAEECDKQEADEGYTTAGGARSVVVD